MLTNWKQARFKVKLVSHCCSQHVSKCTNFTLKGNYPCFLFELHFSQFGEQLGRVCRHVRHFNSNYDSNQYASDHSNDKALYFVPVFCQLGKIHFSNRWLPRGHRLVSNTYLNTCLTCSYANCCWKLASSGAPSTATLTLKKDERIANSCLHLPEETYSTWVLFHLENFPLNVKFQSNNLPENTYLIKIPAWRLTSDHSLLLFLPDFFSLKLFRLCPAFESFGWNLDNWLHKNSQNNGRCPHRLSSDDSWGS